MIQKKIVLDLHRVCTQRCSYCVAGIQKRDNQHFGKITDDLCIKSLVSFIDNYGPFNCILTGGEPLITPNIDYILNSISEKGSHISIQTNLSKNVDKIIRGIKPTSFEWILASLHSVALKNINVFIENAVELQQNGYPVVVKIVCDKPMMDVFEKIAKIFINRNIPFILSPLIEFPNGKPCYAYHYSTSEWVTIQKYISTKSAWLYFASGFMSRGTRCRSGRELFYANISDGNISGCSHGFPSYLGNIYKNEFFPEKTDVVCKIDNCICDFHYYSNVIPCIELQSEFSSLIRGMQTHVTYEEYVKFVNTSGLKPIYNIENIFKHHEPLNSDFKKKYSFVDLTSTFQKLERNTFLNYPSTNAKEGHHQQRIPEAFFCTIPVKQLHEVFGFSNPLATPEFNRTTSLDNWKMEINDAPIFRYIYRNIQPKRHLEFGTWQGAGVVYCLEESDATVWTINLPFGEINPGTKQNAYNSGESFDLKASSKDDWLKKLGIMNDRNVRTDSFGFIGRFYLEKGLGHRVCQIYCDSTQWDDRNYPDGFFDSILIDGGHSADVVASDTQKSIRLLKPGGILLWHDFCPPVENEFPVTKGVRDGVYSLLPMLQKQFEFLAWIDPSWILIGKKKQYNIFDNKFNNELSFSFTNNETCVENDITSESIDDLKVWGVLTTENFSSNGSNNNANQSINTQEVEYTKKKSEPYLSIVVTTRNDDHGGNMIQRFQVFLDHLDDMANRHHLPMELIVVEWNPDPERDPLVAAMDWPRSPWLHSRIITVPPEVHTAHEHHDKFPLFQMIAKNVGIRRARGEFVLATNIDLVFSDELFSFLAQRTLDPLCFYRIDRHDIKSTTIPKEFTWQERLAFCEQNLIRVQGQYGTYAWGDTPPDGDPQRLHTNACGDFTLLSRDMWLRLKGYPEFHLWSIFIDGLLVHAAVAAGLRQVILPDPCRVYHIEHDLGWAKTQTPIAVRPSLDYNNQYLPMCKGMLARGKPLDINADNWGLADMQLQETRPGLSQDGSVGEPTKHPLGSWPYSHWINALTAMEGRLYYRDQSAESLKSLTALARGHAPTVIVELGTLSGMSTRAWILAVPNARIHAVDLSFKAFWKANEHFPVDTSRITFHEQNILAMDFKALWSDSDRVLFFIDAHDLANVPIMRHVLKNALPYLPKDSLVVVDDIWFSRERLGPDNVQEYFDKFLLSQIDELQCFTGHYAPYHKGGSFMGFREVLPLMEFINSRGIDLGYEPGGKHVWFSWDGERHKNQKPVRYERDERESGVIEYNPLAVRANEPLASRILPKVARFYQQGQLQESARLLVDLINKEPSQSACFALAVCQARLGQLDEAYKLVQLARQAGKESWRVNRLADDLDQRVGRPKVRMTGRKGLTIFAVPKAFKGHEDVIQKNAIRSWARLDPKPEIILMGNDHGVREMALEVGARHIPNIATNEFGTPLVDDIFRKAWDVAANDILAYVNADIILMNDFQAAANKVVEQFPEFLVIGQRWDLPVWEEIDFHSSEWMETLSKDVQENGFLHAETGLDYFIHPRGLWSGMPPFALGRTAWDNWLVKRPFEDEIPIIDGTGFIAAVHQDHGYGHCQGGREGAWRGVEAIRNRAMAGTIGDICYVNAAKWLVSREGQLMRANPGKPSWQTDEARNIRRDWLMTQSKRLKSRGRFDLAKAYLEIASAT